MPRRWEALASACRVGTWHGPAARQRPGECLCEPSLPPCPLGPGLYHLLPPAFPQEAERRKLQARERKQATRRRRTGWTASTALGSPAWRGCGSCSASSSCSGPGAPRRSWTQPGGTCAWTRGRTRPGSGTRGGERSLGRGAGRARWEAAVARRGREGAWCHGSWVGVMGQSSRPVPGRWSRTGQG